MPDHKTLAIARWPLSRDQSPPRVRAPMVLECEMEVACGTCGYHVHAPTCRYAPKATAAEPAREGEREGWTAHAPCGGGWSCCYHFADAPGIHVFQNNTTLGDAPGSHHYVTEHRFGAGEPLAFGGTRLECQLHVEANLAASQPKAPPAAQGTFAVGDVVRCVDAGYVAADYLTAGREYTVTTVRAVGSGYEIGFAGAPDTWRPQRFELVRRAGTPAEPKPVDGPVCAALRPGWSAKPDGERFEYTHDASNGHVYYGSKGWRVYGDNAVPYYGEDLIAALDRAEALARGVQRTP